jgi:hypothetical protein
MLKEEGKKKIYNKRFNAQESVKKPTFDSALGTTIFCMKFD